MTAAKCPASFAASKAMPGDVMLCPVCRKPLRLKLMGAERHVVFPAHTATATEVSYANRIARTNAKTNAAMTPKERAASDAIRAALARATQPQPSKDNP